MGSSQHRRAPSPLWSGEGEPAPAGISGSPRVVTAADDPGHQRAGLSTPFCAGTLPAVRAHPHSTYLDGSDRSTSTPQASFQLCLPLGVPPFTISLLGLEAKS